MNYCVPSRQKTAGIKDEALKLLYSTYNSESGPFYNTLETEQDVLVSILMGIVVLFILIMVKFIWIRMKMV